MGFVDHMIWVEYFILEIIELSSVLGFMMGMLKEVLSLLTWVFAYIIAQSFYPSLYTLLEPMMREVPSIRAPLARGCLFVCSILVGSLLQRLAIEFVRVTGLSGSDRALGSVFGLLRGLVIIVLLLTFLPLLIDFSQDAWWQASQLSPVFEAFQNSVMIIIETLIQLVKGTKIAYG